MSLVGPPSHSRPWLGSWTGAPHTAHEGHTGQTGLPWGGPASGSGKPWPPANLGGKIPTAEHSASPPSVPFTATTVI